VIGQTGQSIVGIDNVTVLDAGQAAAVSTADRVTTSSVFIAFAFQ